MLNIKINPLVTGSVTHHVKTVVCVFCGSEKASSSLTICIYYMLLNFYQSLRKLKCFIMHLINSVKIAKVCFISSVTQVIRMIHRGPFCEILGISESPS